MVMFLLSFVKGSKSAEGGPNPLADMDREGPYALADLDRGGGGSESARTPAAGRGFQNTPCPSVRILLMSS